MTTPGPTMPTPAPMPPDLPAFRPDLQELTNSEASAAERYGTFWAVFLISVLTVVLVLGLAYAHYMMGQAPHRLLKVLLAAAALAVILSKPALSLYLLPFAFAYIEWLPVSPIPLLNATNLLLFSLFFGWIGRSVVTRQRFLDPSPWNIPFAVFFTWAFFSWLLGGVHGGGGVGYLLTTFQWFWGEMTGLLLFYMIYNTVRTWAQVRRLALVFCLGTATGLAPLMKEFLLSGGGRWVGGGVGQLNIAGAFFATSSLFTIGLFSGGFRGLWYKVLLLGSMAASTVGMVLPASRGAFVGFLVGVFPQVYRRGVAGVLLLALIIGGFIAWAPAYVKDRVTQTQEAALADGSDRYDAINQDSGHRIDFWKASLQIIKSNPVIGVGFGRTHLAMVEYVGEARAPHNVYLALAGDMGIPGLLFFLWLFWIAFRASRELLPHPGFPRSLALAYRGAIIGLLVANIFGGRIFCFNMGGTVALLTALVFRARALVREGVVDPATPAPAGS